MTITLFIQGAEKIGVIKKLTEATVNKIAAGEVIERPASVVKELVENAIDAGSSQIEIEVENAGLKVLKVSDNGAGIEPGDTELAFKKHSTSKIIVLEDLDRLRTLGFRGEALSSIASVSRVELITKARHEKDKRSDSPAGTKVVLEAGKLLSVKDTGCPEGTIIKIKDLFYNVPARKKYLKSERTELAHITDWVMRFALAYPEIRFRLVKNGTEVLSTQGTGRLFDTIAGIMGSSFARELIPLEHVSDEFKLTGFIGKPVLARRDTTYQFIYVNRRFVNSRMVSRALGEAYHTLLMKHKYPTAILNIEINPAKVDVNIHPTKLAVQFMDEQKVYSGLVNAVSSALKNTELIPGIELGPGNIEEGISLLTQTKFDSVKGKGGQEITAVKTDSDVNSIEPPEFARTPPEEKVQVLRQSQSELNISPESTARGEQVLNFTGIHAAPSMKLETKIGGGAPVFLLGQLHDSYLLIQTGEGMLIIDQHALHERIMYEKFKSLYENAPMISQELIVPASFEFNSRDFQMLISYEDLLNDLGFNLEAFGKNTIRVRAVPTALGRLEDRITLNELLDDLLAMGRLKSEELQREKIIQIMACKAAVKAGQKLTEHEISNILAEASELTSPYTCAHGRPTILSMTLKELEKQFKRTG
jgi:DNA mismatch repair protein MutL